jgi:hypothetical protein
MDAVVTKPNELFFLAKCMNAKYIDYSYIKDVSGQKASDQEINDTVSSLEDKEYLFAGFDGSIEIDSEVSEILKPVFFGETEIRLIAGEKQVNYHVLDSMVTICERSDDLLSFTKTVRKPDFESFGELHTTGIVIQTANVKTGYQRKEFRPEETDQAWDYIASELERRR